MAQLPESRAETLVRDREPLEYIVELPATPNLMQKEYPKQYAAAYPDGDVPIKVPSAFHADVMLLDGTYKCRGGNTKDGDTSELTASLEALSRLVCFRQQEPRESTIPGLKFFEKPAGKPMRSLQNLCGHASLQDRRHAALRALTLPPIADVSPGGGEAQKEEHTAQAEHQETEEEKENDPLEEENIDTQLYEKKEEAAPAAIVAVEKTEKDEKEADTPLASFAVGAIIIITRIITMITIRIIIIGIRLRRRGRRRRRRITIRVVLITTTPTIKTTIIIKGTSGKARTDHGQARRA